MLLAGHEVQSLVESNNFIESILILICKSIYNLCKELERARILRDLFVSSCNDEELEQTFQIFARSDVTALINEVGDIEKPVPLGIRLLKDVPEFRKMAARATWALLTG